MDIPGSAITHKTNIYPSTKCPDGQGKKNEAGIHSPDGQKEKKNEAGIQGPDGQGKRLNAGIRGPDGPRNTFSYKKKKKQVSMAPMG